MTHGATSLVSVDGDNRNVIAGLCYLLGLVAVILFFTEQRNGFLKFHAAQALLIHVGAIISSLFWMLTFLAIIVTGAAAAVGTSSAGFISNMASVAVLSIFLVGIALFFFYLTALICGMIAAFTGRATKLPLAGELAERLVSESPPRP